MAITGYQTMNLYDVILNWQQFGFFDIILPFLLIFTISFAVLQKVKIFGEKAKNINVIVALVIALLFLQNTYLIFVLQRLLPNVAIILVIVLLFLLLIGVWGAPIAAQGKYVKVAFWVSVLAVLIALTSDFVPGVNVLMPLVDFFNSLGPQVPGLVLIAIIVIGAIALATSTGKEEKGGK